MRKRVFVFTTLLSLSVAALVLATFSNLNKKDFSSSNANETSYSLTLNSSNAYVSGSTQVVDTDSKAGKVTFSLTDATSSSGNYCQLASGGTLKNTDKFTSLVSFLPNFVGGLQARLSYDGSSWSDYFSLGDDILVNTDSNPYFVELKATKTTIIESIKYTYSCLPNENIPTESSETLLGVFDFYSESNLSNTNSNDEVNLSYANAHAFTDVGGSSLSIASSVSATLAYQKRYGGIGMGSGSNGGSLSISLKNGYKPDKVVVSAASYKTANTNLTLNTTAKAVEAIRSTEELNCSNVTWNFDSAQSTLQFTSGSGNNRMAIYRIYLYGSGEAMPIPDNPAKFEIGFTASVSKSSYYTDEKFDASTLSVVKNYSDGTTEDINDFEYQIVKSGSSTPIDLDANFLVKGTYILSVTYGTYAAQEVELTINEKTAVTGVTLNKDATSIEEGKTETLVATVTPNDAYNKAVSWTSSNEDVATVSNAGLVTALAQGTTTITVTTTDGGFSDTCLVTVTEATQGSIETLTILVEDIPTQYSGTSFSAGGVNFGCTNIGNSYTSGAMQWKKSGDGTMYNIDAITGLSSITLNTFTGKTFSGTIYSGTTSQPSSNSASISNGVKYEFPDGVSYFKIETNSGGASYCEDIEIEYINTPINPTSISMGSSLELAIGKSKTLSVSYLPENANQNKELLWESSNESVATVNNQGKVTAKNDATVGQTATITATLAFKNTIKATCTVTIVEEQLAAYTLLFYVCGANLESDCAPGGQYASYPGAASDDINEIISTSNQPDDVNIVLETGGAKKWDNYLPVTINADELGLWHVENKQLIKDGAFEDDSMGKASTLQAFLEYGFENYPAEKYGLFMWNHGGAMDGCCFDENHDDDSLTNAEVYQAVHNAKMNNGINDNLEFIAYDACLMAVQDIAEFNSLNFNYMLCSQETEWSGGYDYDQWLPTLYNNPDISTKTLLQKIADTFLDEQEGDNHRDQTQSVLDLTKMSAYLEAWENMTDGLKTIVNSSSKWTTFKNIVNQARKFGEVDDYSQYNSGYVYDIFDVKGALNLLKNNGGYSAITSEIDAVLAAFNDVVVYERHGSQMSGSNGLCFFCAISGFNSASPSYAASDTHFTKWRAFIIQYGNWYN